MRTALVLLLLLTGCAEPPRGPESLIDHSAWQDHSPDTDPWAAERPGDDALRCDPLSVFVDDTFEDSSLEVDLDYCNYSVQTQPTLVSVLAGDTVTLRLWRAGFFFSTDEPVHLALRLGDVDVLDVEVPAPSDGGTLEYVEWTADRDFLEATTVRFLVNTHQEFEEAGRHGGNSVNLIELSRVDPAWEPETE